MNHCTTPTTGKRFQRTAPTSPVFLPGFIAGILLMFFGLSSSAQDVTPPVLKNPSIGCSSLNMVNVDPCYYSALQFDGKTLESSVAALYDDPSLPVTALLLSVTPSQNDMSTANIYCSWKITYEFKIRDHAGNFVTCFVTRTGHDNIFPTYTVPGPVIFYQNGLCDFPVPPDPSVSGSVTNAADNCGIESITYEDGDIRRAVECNGTKIIERMWHVLDSCGNMTDRLQLIEIRDTIRPVFTIVPNNLTASSCRSVSYTVEATDNCSGFADLTYTLSGATTETGLGSGDGAVFNEGLTHVTVTATDCAGNTDQRSFTVSVSDNVPPVIMAPDISKAYAEDNYGCSIDLGATASDNCHVVSFTNNAPPCFPVGTTMVVWTAVDQHGNTSTYTQKVTRIPPTVNISICAGKTRTIYRGTVGTVGPLGPQSINLTGTATGGSAPYTYSWSPATGLSNPNIANPVANPSVTTTYTLTVTDNLGVSRSLSITINVLPLSSAVYSGNGNNLKFRVCHRPPGNPANVQNIVISVNALNAHLVSGSNGHNNCYLGTCSYNCISTTPNGQSQYNGRGVNGIPDGSGPTSDKFTVNVSPNPTNREFLIQVFSKSIEPVTVRIFDNNGALRTVSSPAAGTNYVIVGKNLAGGTYMAEVVQGNNRKVVKLVKLK